MYSFTATTKAGAVTGLINRKGQVAFGAVGNHSFIAAVFSRMTPAELQVHDACQAIKAASYSKPYTLQEVEASLNV